MNEIGDTIKCRLIDIKRQRFSIEEMRVENISPFNGYGTLRDDLNKRYAYYLRSECGLYKVKILKNFTGYNFKIIKNILIEKKVKNEKY